MSVPERREFLQFIRQQVRWADADRLGHVNNAKFFTYSESARMDYFQPLTERDPRFYKDYGLILASTSCDFLAQVHHPAELEVGMRVEKIGRTSFTARTAIFLGESVVAVLGSVIVWFDYAQQKSLPVPEDVRAWVRGREAIAPLE